MEKDLHQPESLATVTIKPDYAPSESFTSEPPPAYHKPQSSAVQVAKIISFTVIAVTVVLGCFMLASAYVTASASCKQLEQEMQFLAEASDRLQPLQPEALVQEEQQAVASKHVELNEEKPKKEVEEVSENKIDEKQKNDDDSSEEDEEKTIHIKMPLELNFDDLAGALIGQNQKSRMNCVVEKKRAEQLVDHQPKTIQLPFGLNLTTDPKYEHISGERMAIFCESGREQSNNNNQDDDQDDEEETIMIQPIMIPIPHTNFQTHMPMQAQQPPMINRMPIPQQPPMVNRLPMSPPQQPMHPMEAMRPPMPAPMEQNTPAFPPNQILHHIAQQIIAQRLQMEAARNQEEQSNESQEDEQSQEGHQYTPSEYMMPQRIPLPEQILTQLNRLPNSDVIVAVSQPDEEQDDQNQENPTRDNQIVQQQRESAHEMNGRQIYARQMPMNIPLRIVPIQQVPVQQAQVQPTQQVQQDPQASGSEEMRPHFVHPRSVRSVDNILPKSIKRVKRCACDCAC